jgi:hypothetical protein
VGAVGSTVKSVVWFPMKELGFVIMLAVVTMYKASSQMGPSSIPANCTLMLFTAANQANKTAARYAIP